MKSIVQGDLIPAGTYAFHSRFQRVVNFTDGRFLLALATEAVGPGPLNLVVDALFPGPMAGLEAGPWGIRVDGRELAGPDCPRYHSAWAGQGLTRAALASRLPLFLERILQGAAPESAAFVLDPGRRSAQTPGFQKAYAEEIIQGAELLFGEDPALGALRLKGRGPGLTPGGDDFLAGHLFGLQALRRMGGRGLSRRSAAVHRAALGSNPFSNTALTLARLGRPFGRLMALLEALATGSPQELADRADHVLAMGASSGADLAAGLHLTLSKGVAQWL
jgi:hypothetical protein